MPELLTGTVTFLFSDIESSTRLLQADRESWPSMLARHQQLMRAAFERHEGREVGTEGDSFFVAFPTAPGAVAAAVEAQRAIAAEPWPAGLEIRVRMGLHTGEASMSTGSYVGLNVHRANRIANAGHGGQVLISHVTRTLLDSGLPEGIELRDLGEVRLRDLQQAEHLHQVVISGLRNDFPPLRSLDAPNNLPKRLTTFLGREAEIGEVERLLARTRLLTLTGPGGTGKTRLSLEVAQRAAANHPGGVYFVELAPIREPDLVLATIAQTLSLPDRGGRTSLDRLADHIGEGRMLLVLDNFEQVTDAAPEVNALLAACPNLTILVSSRSSLQVSGEQEYPVPPMGLPDLAHLPPLTQLSQYEAVALFVERARAVRPNFVVTNENAPAVAEICVRLDGLPLAIELAAARIRILTPQAMLARLEHRLGLLAGGGRDLPERQRTLRGAIAWSHDMLDETDRTLFACLGTFVGGAGLGAIEEVCGGEVSGEFLDALTSLVEKSLVRQSEGVDGEPRFTMLETIREFAIEQAMERGRWDELRASHARLFLELAESLAGQVMGAEQRSTLDRLEQDHDNLRAAMAWGTEAGGTETALRLGSALWRFWQMRGYLAEGLERVRQALALPDSPHHPEARADALSAAAGLAYWLADVDGSRSLYEEEILARSELGDRRGLAEAHYGIAFTWAVIDLRNDANAARSEEHVREALRVFRELDDTPGIGRCEWALSNVAWGTGRLEAAREHALRSLEVFEAIDDRFMTGWASYTVGLTELSESETGGGDEAAAREEARSRLTHALRIFAEAQDLTGYALVLDAFAILARDEGDAHRAARLSGAVRTLERTSGTGLNLWNRAAFDFEPEQLLADPSLAEGWAAGEALSPTEAVAYALGE